MDSRRTVACDTSDHIKNANSDAKCSRSLDTLATQGTKRNRAEVSKLIVKPFQAENLQPCVKKNTYHQMSFHSFGLLARI